MTVRRPRDPWRGRMQGRGGGSWLCRPHFAAGPEAITQDRNPYPTIEAAPQTVSLLAVTRLSRVHGVARPRAISHLLRQPALCVGKSPPHALRAARHLIAV